MAYVVTFVLSAFCLHQYEKKELDCAGRFRTGVWLFLQY